MGDLGLYLVLFLILVFILFIFRVYMLEMNQIFENFKKI